MLNRLNERFNERLPMSQTAYRRGRSTTENVFTFKILAEKATITSNMKVNIMLLDMTKAFDSVNRETLMNDLRTFLEPDELHIIKILLQNMSLAVRCEGRTSDSFNTDTGIPQGDSLSPVLFTLYLANSLKGTPGNGGPKL